MSDYTAIPLRKKYYTGEQVITAISKHVKDYDTLMAIFNSFTGLDGIDIEDNDAYNKGFLDGARYAVKEMQRKFVEEFDRALIYGKVKRVDAPGKAVDE